MNINYYKHAAIMAGLALSVGLGTAACIPSLTYAATEESLSVETTDSAVPTSDGSAVANAQEAPIDTAGAAAEEETALPNEYSSAAQEDSITAANPSPSEVLTSAPQTESTEDPTVSTSAPEATTTEDGFNVINEKVDEIIIPKATTTDPIDDKNQSIFGNVEGLYKLTGKADGTMPETDVDGGKVLAYITAKSKTGGDILYVGYVGKGEGDEFYSIVDTETFDPDTLELHYVVKNTESLKSKGEVSIEVREPSIVKSRTITIKSVSGAKYKVGIPDAKGNLILSRSDEEVLEDEDIEVIIPIQNHEYSGYWNRDNLIAEGVKFSHKVLNLSKFSGHAFIPIEYKHDAQGNPKWIEAKELRDKIPGYTGNKDISNWIHIENFKNFTPDDTLLYFGSSNIYIHQKSYPEKTQYACGSLSLDPLYFTRDTVNQWGYHVNSSDLWGRMYKFSFTVNDDDEKEYLSTPPTKVGQGDVFFAAYHFYDNTGNEISDWSSLDDVSHATVQVPVFKVMELKESSSYTAGDKALEGIDLKELITRVPVLPARATEISMLLFDESQTLGSYYDFSENFDYTNAYYVQRKIIPYEKLPSISRGALNKEYFVSYFDASPDTFSYFDFIRSNYGEDSPEFAIVNEAANRPFIRFELVFYENGNMSKPQVVDKVESFKVGTYAVKVHRTTFTPSSDIPFDVWGSDAHLTGSTSFVPQYLYDDVVTTSYIYVDGRIEEPKTVTRTIRFHTPDGIKEQKQTATLNRSYFLNTETGEKSDYSDWSEGMWDAYSAPEFAGWVADTPIIEKANVTGDTKDEVIDIYYIKNADEVEGSTPENQSEATREVKPQGFQESSKSKNPFAQVKATIVESLPVTADTAADVAGIGAAGILALIGSLFVRKNKKQG